MRIVAILTSHNRREKTLTCLRSYFRQQLRGQGTLDAVLVDDGCSDGTAEAVRDLGEPVTVVVGTGDLYWAGGMALAEERALPNTPDYLLWLNDDVVLDPDALERLLAVARENGDACVVVGALRDSETKEVTYSGVTRHRFHPLRFDLVAPNEKPLSVDTFNGNVVLVPRYVTSVVGAIDGQFPHGSADFDYGARVVKAGLTNLLAPGTIGICPRDSQYAPWLDRSIPLRERTKYLLDRKGVPPRARARYLRRHGGPLWPVFWLLPYARFVLSLLPFPARARIRRR